MITRSLSLEQNAPNPFSDETEIRFFLPEAAFVRLTVCDALGRERALLAEGQLNAGAHKRALNARALPAGSYAYRLQTGARVLTKQCLIAK